MNPILDALQYPLPANAENSMPVWAWLLLAALLLTQGAWLFRDAKKRDAWPWFWGIWGCIQFPTPLVVYWLLVRGGAQSIKRRYRRRRRPKGEKSDERTD